MGALRTESVERALSILSAFGIRRPKMSLAELAAETGLHKSTILRLTRSMAIYGFIDRDAEGRFSIGASVWHLGLIFRQEFDSAELIRPVLRRLVDATGETASYFVRAGNDRVCLFRENSPSLEKYGVEEGVRLRLGTGASGLVLRRNTGEELPDLSVFNAHGTVSLDATRNPNIASISTPVFSASGHFRGALTISGLNARFTEEIRTRAVPILENYARELGAKID
ncbi:helix-turn-helix domain-containing protein [Ancylobacter sp. MQZ15Z-1]|uniref:Helix-turn-helix domain-containing protein n=1 Tax=Ancylobacter mangrovi TaxID=2972472 RepID=A0A9X2PBZ7_9HYPH|nr:helix-turn-helix domain-containing protein [Ancylobacter mangrovi]MCS0494599.1 helix-turn-helix domain-containing protein [Ancylobacter mangrovi]